MEAKIKISGTFEIGFTFEKTINLNPEITKESVTENTYYINHIKNSSYNEEDFLNTIESEIWDIVYDKDLLEFNSDLPTESKIKKYFPDCEIDECSWNIDDFKVSKEDLKNLFKEEIEEINEKNNKKEHVCKQIDGHIFCPICGKKY